MEDSQRRHIQDNLHKLVRITECSTLFLVYLVEHRVFSDEDVSLLERESDKFQKNHRMYRIMITRSNSYDILCKALEETHQSGPLDILKCMHSTANTTTTNSTFRQLSDIQRAIGNLQLGQHMYTTLEEHREHIGGKLVIQQQLPSLPNYYIKRSLTSRYNLQKEILQNSTKAVFVIEGMQKHHLTTLAGGNTTDESGNQIDGLAVRHITLQCNQDYDTICKLSPEPVHWIKYTEKTGTFKLVKSSKTVSVPQNFVHETQDELTEDELVSKTGEVVIISGSPGAGKTMLLCSIAQFQEPNSLVLFLVMKELVERYRRLWLLDISRCIDIIDLIIEAILGNEKFGLNPYRVSYVKHQMSRGNCTLLLDGFDEVYKPHLTQAKEILCVLRNQKSTRLFLTTRPHMLRDLENDLTTLGFTLEIFNETDQRRLLIGYWKSEGIVPTQCVRDLASSILTSLAHKMRDFERAIAGIPLQCRLFAEVYSDRARRGVKFNDDEASAVLVPIFELYKRLVNLRISDKDKIYKAIISNHMLYALRLLFPETYHCVEDIAPKNPPILESHMLRLGILEKSSTTEMRFVHHTFAEYFAAWFVVDKKWGNLPLKSDIWLSNILGTTEMQTTIKTPVGKSNTVNLFCFNYPEICFFINGFMKDRFQPNDTNNVHSMLTNNYFATEPQLIASAFHKYTHFPYAVARFQRKFDQSRELEVAALSETMFNDLLITTALYADVELMKLFGSFRNINLLQASVKTDLDSFVITPMHIAVQRGDYSLVEYLVGKYESVLHTLRFLFHFCVFDSEGDNSSTVENKKQIITLLSAKSKQWVNEPLANGIIPLTQKKVHLDLVICLYKETQKLEV